MVVASNPPGQYADDRNLGHASACGGTRIRTLTSWPGSWILPGSRRGCGCGMLAVATVSTCARWPGGPCMRPGVTGRPWPDVVEDVRQDVQAVIDRDGVFTTFGDLAAFVCRYPADAWAAGRP